MSNIGKGDSSSLELSWSASNPDDDIRFDLSAVRFLVRPTKTSQLSNDSGFLSAVPDSYKTYDATVSSLSDNGYALQSQVSSKADTSAVMLLSAN